MRDFFWCNGKTVYLIWTRVYKGADLSQNNIFVRLFPHRWHTILRSAHLDVLRVSIHTMSCRVPQNEMLTCKNYVVNKKPFGDTLHQCIWTSLKYGTLCLPFFNIRRGFIINIHIIPHFRLCYTVNSINNCQPYSFVGTQNTITWETDIVWINTLQPW